MGALFIVAFFVAIGGLVTLGVGLSVYQKRAAHRLQDDAGDDRLALMEARLEELERRVEDSERALSRERRPRELPSRDPE